MVEAWIGRSGPQRRAAGEGPWYP